MGKNWKAIKKGCQSSLLASRQRVMSAAWGSGVSASDVERIWLEHKKLAVALRARASIQVTNCDDAGCWNNLCNRYSRVAGTAYIRQDSREYHDISGG